MSLLKRKKTRRFDSRRSVEQAKLREEYIEGYRRSVRHHIEGIKVVDEEGNDVTPEKLRQIQREKGLHGRSLDDPESIITMNKGLECFQSPCFEV